MDEISGVADRKDALPLPGTTVAVRRLQAHFPPPRSAVGEAWFMGESRRYYETLLDPHRIRADNAELLTALEEIGSGQVCFGPKSWPHPFEQFYPVR